MDPDGDGPGRPVGGRGRLPWGPAEGRARFWGSASAAAAAAAAAAGGFAGWYVAREPPAGTVRMLGTAEVWLLGVFSAGAVAVLLGLAARLGGLRRAGDAEERGAGAGAAEWAMAVGALLLGLYAAGWAWTR